MGALTAASGRVDRALEACWEADAEVVAAALHLLCLRAREAHADAVAVQLWWSDQGDFLDVHSLEGPDGQEIDWFDEESLAWSLGGRAESGWMLFVEADHRDHRLASFRLPIGPTLDHFNRQEGLR